MRRAGIPSTGAEAESHLLSCATLEAGCEPWLPGLRPVDGAILCRFAAQATSTPAGRTLPWPARLGKALKRVAGAGGIAAGRISARSRNATWTDKVSAVRPAAGNLLRTSLAKFMADECFTCTRPGIHYRLGCDSAIVTGP
ncbi:hypothetical protein JOF39_003258 [Glutamicibacter protophormiae]|uniref:Uncharacterized protein n=1 Tax=Glutamicibacter protophormiae TaxID=37930 RepID=A0ABS4XUK9_GLUPR|nr:hypothetical protein [Glutamicibacter protophormiae]